jgi:hypothetical protein
VNDSVVNPIIPSLGFPYPLTLTCIITKKENTFSDIDYIKKRIEKAGSLDNLYKTYVCKAGKKIQKEQLGGVATDREPGKGTSVINPTDESVDHSGRCRQASHDQLTTGTLHQSETWTTGTVVTTDEYDTPRGRIVHRSFKHKDGTVCNVYAPKPGT